MENILLISDTMVKERTAIHGNIDPKLIYPDIKVAQDMYILPVLGSALYFKLQTIISDNTITTDGNLSAYKTLVDIYIVDALIYFTLSELPTTISYQFWNKGVMRKQGLDTDLPSMSDLIDLSNKYRNRAEFYANRLKKYLQQNANTLFPEYYASLNGIDSMYPDQKSFTSPIYLGSDKYNNNCDSPFPYGWDRNKPYGQ
jgi:hypothetical protein